ncbi:methyl-accepting chemotaxis protein [Brevibacillus nitrificans]|uniref:Methyl-accepting chemotaxis protein n=1 Tax=Brevibacillus nitrificans TaxID=651560 RepID=A0A3M8DHY5_9BACL|nr:methyl-accepting chemotaxis protein [Brevibacillus nitrificans]RNB86757.1 methyl-accepting chemotaxis protein [Brevibacillus nitrificans]
MSVSIGKKLFLSFLVVSFLFLIASTVSYVSFTKVDDSYTDLVGRRAAILANAEKIQGQVFKRASGIRGYLVTMDTRYIEDMNKAHESVEQLIGATSLLLQRPVDQERLHKLQTMNQEYRIKSDELQQMAHRGESTENMVRYYSQEIRPIAEEMETLVGQVVIDQEQIMHEGSEANTQMVTAVRRLLIGISIVATLLAIAVGWYMTKKIARPILQIAQAAEQIAAGNVALDPIQVKNRDEIGMLAESFHKMAANLRELIQKVGLTSGQVVAYSEQLRASAEQTTEATNQIADSIQGVANGTEVQGQGAQESARAMGEMAVGIGQIAEAVASVSEEAAKSNQEAKNGDEMLQAVMQQMNAISQSTNETTAVIQQLRERSAHIGKIIDVITGIADQTNLLSLNAAIEAARAGEQGRGFAVVAHEVRKLAEQSRHSSEQISGLIHDIQSDTEKVVQAMAQDSQEVAAGLEYVRKTGDGFARIVHSVESVSNQIHELSSVSEEMSASAQQVSASIEEMSKIAKDTADNAQNVASASEEQLASMEEITASAVSLAQMAEELESLIKRFTL